MSKNAFLIIIILIIINALLPQILYTVDYIRDCSYKVNYRFSKYLKFKKLQLFGTLILKRGLLKQKINTKKSKFKLYSIGEIKYAEWSFNIDRNKVYTIKIEVTDIFYDTDKILNIIKDNIHFYCLK